MNEKIVYKVRANRACWLYIDGERIQQLKANKMAKIQLGGGEYLRKVVDCEEAEVFREDKIQLQEKNVVDDIDLAVLYQKHLRRRGRLNFDNEIWEKCKLFFRQRLGWIISVSLVCAVVVGLYFRIVGNENKKDDSVVIAEKLSDSCVVDIIVGEEKIEQKEVVVAEVKKEEPKVDNSFKKDGEEVETEYKKEKKEETVVEKKQSMKNVVNGHECVDLGLSVKWATCNVGANSPEEYGYYFAWGETEPKIKYTWSMYKYGTSKDQLTKYCT